eukprot:2891718-Pyramimonas_sp.AAC.1
MHVSGHLPWGDLGEVVGYSIWSWCAVRSRFVKDICELVDAGEVVDVARSPGLNWFGPVLLGVVSVNHVLSGED